MGKRIANILRGMGSILEIAPHPDRAVSRPLYQREHETTERAIYRTWARVGDSLIAASGAKLIGETESTARRVSAG